MNPKSAFFSHKIFLYSILQVPILSLFILPKASFFCWAQKKLNAHAFFFFFLCVHNWKSLTKDLGIWSCFPTIKLRFNVSNLINPRTCDWTTVCSHTAAAFSGRVLVAFFKSVAGHSVYLPTNYLLHLSIFCIFFFSSVLFNKHSSNELNGRLTNQYWSQRCSTQVVKGQMLPKYRMRKNWRPTGIFFSSFIFSLW